MRTRTRYLTLAAVCGLAVFGAASAAVAQGTASEVQVELIERFIRLIEWPAGSSVADANSPFTVGVLGDHPISLAMREFARNQRIKNKRVEVRQLSDVAGMRGCEAVFISRSFENALEEIVHTARDEAILTLADSPGFGKRGVMINFTMQAEFVRFEINPKSAEASGLTFAPQLLRLGTTIQ